MAIEYTKGDEVEVLHEGRVLQTQVTMGHFYDGYETDYGALVWDDATAAAKMVHTHTTMGSDRQYRGFVDAADDCYLALLPQKVAAHYDKLVADERAYRSRRASQIDRFTDVVVVAGRPKDKEKDVKIPHGTEARVFWVGANQWGTSVGAETADGLKFFTSIGNVRSAATAAPISPDDLAEYRLRSIRIGLDGCIAVARYNPRLKQQGAYAQNGTWTDEGRALIGQLLVAAAALANDVRPGGGDVLVGRIRADRDDRWMLELAAAEQAA